MTKFFFVFITHLQVLRKTAEKVEKEVERIPSSGSAPCRHTAAKSGTRSWDPLYKTLIPGA